MSDILFKTIVEAPTETNKLPINIAAMDWSENAPQDYVWNTRN